VDCEASVQSFDGRAAIHYSRPGRTQGVTQRFRPVFAGNQRWQASWNFQNQQHARPSPVRRRSRFQEVGQQHGSKYTGEGARDHSCALQHQHVRREQLVLDNSGKVKQPFVSFYFTNVPENVSYISLRRGFEVCGIMEDVYLARKRNVNGGVFGFVCYGNVRDVDKLLKALNNVWFGDCRVVAKVASFDRLGNKYHGEGVKGEGGNNTEIDVGCEGVNCHVGRGKYIEENNLTVPESDVGAEAVGRGEVVMKAVEGTNLKEGVLEYANVGRRVQNVEEGINQVYIPKYTSSVSDMSWASKGVVVSVLSRDAIPVLQRRISDAGFDNLAVIPLGADKVFMRSLDDADVSITLSEAADFFDLFFSKPVRWNKDTLVQERGAWLRIYGVPLHTWNFDFFKLCVYDCGRLLRLDDITLDRDRFDYAWLLVSTSSLDVIKHEANMVVDGVLLKFQIIEEWGFSLGEDACLLDDEAFQVDNRSDMPDDLDTGFRGGDVDELLNTLSADWKIEDEAHHIKPSSSPVTASVKVPSSSSPAPAVLGPVEDRLLVPEAESTPARASDKGCKVDRLSKEFFIDNNSGSASFFVPPGER